MPYWRSLGPRPIADRRSDHDDFSCPTLYAISQTLSFNLSGTSFGTRCLLK